MLERAGHSNISAVPHTTQCIHNQSYSCIFRPQLSVASAGLLAPVLLVISMLMATPLFFHTQLDDFKINVDNPNYHVYCVEKWSQNSTVEEGIERTYYTYFSMAMQYVVPFVIMASIYLKIFYYLKTYRLFWMGVIRDSSINQKATTSLVFFFRFAHLLLVSLSWKLEYCAWAFSNRKRTAHRNPDIALTKLCVTLIQNNL